MKRAFLVGKGVSHSVAPFVHTATAERLGLDWRYELLDVDAPGLEGALERLRAEDCTGANITMPYKEAAAAYADERSPAVDRCGATNTLVNDDGRLVAYNGDAVGMEFLLRRRADAIGRGGAVVVGAGGAAAAALEALRGVPPTEIVVLARRAEQARALVERAASWMGVPLRAGAMADAERELRQASLVVNATSLGMRPEDPSPVPAPALRPDLLVYDFVYARGSAAVGGKTALQLAAIERGSPLCDGAAHILAQAGPSFDLLAGERAPEGVVRALLVEALGREPIDWGVEGD